MPLPTTRIPARAKLTTFAPNRVSLTHNYRKVVRSASVHRWRLTLTYGDMIREEADELFAYLVSQGGQFGTFDIPLTVIGRDSPVGIYNSGSDSPVVNGAHSVEDTTIATSGWRNNGTALCKKGSFVQFAGDNKLYILTEQVDSNGSGQATLTIYPGIKTALVGAEVVSVETMNLRASLLNDAQDMAVTQPVLGNFTLDFVEDLN